MIHDRFPGISLHNVTETEAASWTNDGHRLLRVPASVADELNVGARERMRHLVGCELRFVPETDEGTVSVTLSAPTATRAQVFWGEFQGYTEIELQPEPRTVELAVPEPLRRLEDGTGGRFDPRVCRLRFEPDAPVAVHVVSGPCRPPVEDELPNHRYLAYGTSITEGAAATAIHLGYVSRVARRLGVDAVTLGCSGSAFCEPAIAEYIARRDDWDIASLSVLVNMANRGFTVERFRNRVGTIIGRLCAFVRPSRLRVSRCFRITPISVVTMRHVLHPFGRRFGTRLRHPHAVTSGWSKELRYWLPPG